MNTDSFLGAFSHFSSRRGTPHLIYSDNGINLTAGEKELREIMEKLDQEKIRRRHATFDWNLWPPGASHMAGAWERLIRSTKSILRALLKTETKKLITDEGIYTLLCEVEHILNDRPITSNANGLDDAPALTPNMLLTFQRRTTPTLEDYDPREAYATMWWRHIQHLSTVFWRRFTAEYIRPTTVRNGCVLNLRSKSMTLCWLPMSTYRVVNGRLEELKPSSDDQVRTVKVMVAGKEVLRPIFRLCLLEQNTC